MPQPEGRIARPNFFRRKVCCQILPCLDFILVGIPSAKDKEFPGPFRKRQKVFPHLVVFRHQIFVLNNRPAHLSPTLIMPANGLRVPEQSADPAVHANRLIALTHLPQCLELGICDHNLCFGGKFTDRRHLRIKNALALIQIGKFGRHLIQQMKTRLTP